jgi:signal transduction histidine kinase
LTLDYFGISTLSGGVIALSTGIFAYRKKKDHIANKTYLLFSISVALWSIGFFLLISTSDKEIATWGYRIHNASVFIPATHLHFVLSLLGLQKEKAKQLLLSYAISCFLLLFTFTPYYISGLVPKYPFNFYIEPRLGYYLLFLHFGFWVVYALRQLVLEIRKSSGYKSIHLRYLALALIIGFIGGGSSFLLTFNIPFPPYVLIFFGIYPIIIAYTITRYRFMDVQIMFKRGMAYSLSVGLLTALFIILVLVCSEVVSSFSGRGGLGVSIFSALTVALLFSPLKNRVQLFIDKLFYKASYDFYAVIGKVGQELSAKTHVKEIQQLVIDVLISTFKLKQAHFLSARKKYFFTVYYSGLNPEPIPVDRERRTLKVAGELFRVIDEARDIIIKDDLPYRIGQHRAAIISDEIGRFSGEVAAPVVIDGEVKAIIVLGGKVSGDVFSAEDIDLLRAITNDAALSMKSAILYTEKMSAERMATLGSTAATFAHEIKNPLTAIKTFTQLLPEKYNDAEFRETFTRIVPAEIQRMDRLVMELLTFAKKTAPKQQMDVVELSAVADECIKFYSQQFTGNSIRILKQLRTPLFIRGDADKLKQAIINIISNSYQAMEGTDGMIGITTRYDDGRAIVSIEDTGPGISDHDMERIFEPFFTTKAMGNGLGLTITKKMVEDLGGKISVSSRRGKGTIFALSFDAVDRIENGSMNEGQVQLWN